jgi:hypothetical protein
MNDLALPVAGSEGLPVDVCAVVSRFRMRSLCLSPVSRDSGTLVRAESRIATRDALRPPLLSLHKAVLTAERRSVERVHGAMSASEFLQLVSDPVRYGWLKPLTVLVLDFDDEDAEEDVLVRRTRELLLPPRQDTPFGRRYLSLMQREPALVLAHSQLARLL